MNVRIDTVLCPRVWARKDQLQHASTRGGLTCAMYPNTDRRADLEPLYSLTAEEVAAVDRFRVRQDEQSNSERVLRRLLALRSGIPHLYTDDGEASGAEHGISIDFMREPVADIDAKLSALNVARAIAAEKVLTVNRERVASIRRTEASESLPDDYEVN